MTVTAASCKGYAWMSNCTSHKSMHVITYPDTYSWHTVGLRIWGHHSDGLVHTASFSSCFVFILELSTVRKTPGDIFTCILAKGPRSVLPVNRVTVIVYPVSIGMKWDSDTFGFEVVATTDGSFYRSPHLVQCDAEPIGIVIQMFGVTLKWKIQSHIDACVSFWQDSITSLTCIL